MRYGDLIIAGAGVATVLADFDFETYSEAGFVWSDEEQKFVQLPGISNNKKKGLPTVGLYNYVRHPTFEVLSLAYNLKDGTGAHFWRPGLPYPEDLFAHIRTYQMGAVFAQDGASWEYRYDVPGLIEGWRVGFELEVWNTYCVKVLGWPELWPAQVRCAMAKAKEQGYPGALANAGPAIHLPPQYLKDPEGDRLINLLTVPKKPTKKEPNRRWTRITAPQEFAKFDAYNVQDIVTESQASMRIPDLPPREMMIWQFDQRRNRRGMQIATEDMQACIVIIEQCIEKWNARLRYITNGAVSSYSKGAEIIRFLHGHGIHLDELDEDVVAEQLARPNLGDVAKEVLEIRQKLSFGSVKKMYAMRARVGADGRLRDEYDYSGSHTRLWNGQNVQVANLYSGKFKKPEQVEHALAVIRSGSLEYVEGVYGDALEVIANCLRSMIVAPPGHDLIAADFTAIQAVVTGCLAGQDSRTEIFRTHGKVYEQMASDITGKPLQFYLDYRKRTGEHHEDRQTFGKIPVLATDFGAWIGGWKRFGAEVLGDDQAIKQVILKAWAANPHIVELWGGQVRNKFKDDEHQALYGLEGCAVAAVKEPGKCFGYRGVRYLMQGDALYCQPPHDGPPLVYHEPMLEPARREWSRPWELALSYMGWNSNQTKGKGGWVRMKLYGGVLTQNVVSNTAREFQADALVAFDRTDTYAPVMDTHDEIVCEVREGRGSVEEYLSIYRKAFPRWAVHYDGKFAGEPWPVKVPGAERTKRYGKWEL